MAGGAGTLRTLRISGANGSKTLGSLIASGSSSGGGSARRIYGYYASLGESTTQIYANFGLYYGKFRGQAQWFGR
jgi:hypothetical protein